MKAFGVILIVVGILMIVFKGFNFEKEKNVLEIGDLEVNKTEDKHIGWPTYAGGAVLLVGVVLTVSGIRKGKSS